MAILSLHDVTKNFGETGIIRGVSLGSQICRALNLKKITVLGTPTKYNAVSGFNIEITGFVNE